MHVHRKGEINTWKRSRFLQNWQSEHAFNKEIFSVVFHYPTHEIAKRVFVNDISTAALEEEKELLQDAMQITANREEDSTNEIVKVPTPSKQSNIFDAQTNKLKDSYMTTLQLRNIINEVKPTMPWPPTSEHLNKKAAETLVPCSLYNFIAWTVRASEEPVFENFVQVTPSIYTKLLSISQDIISLASKGRKLMPFEALVTSHGY